MTKSASKVFMLWTGNPSGGFGVGLGFGAVGNLGRLHRRGSFRACLAAVVVLEQQGSQPPPQVPFDVIGEHAQEQVGSDPVGIFPAAVAHQWHLLVAEEKINGATRQSLFEEAISNLFVKIGKKALKNAVGT